MEDDYHDDRTRTRTSAPWRWMMIVHACDNHYHEEDCCSTCAQTITSINRSQDHCKSLQIARSLIMLIVQVDSNHYDNCDGPV